MKHEDVKKLEDIPNVGRIIAEKFRCIGIDQPGDLLGRDPYVLFEQLQDLTEKKHDPCLLDVFISAVRYMEGAPGMPWWSYTRERKEMLHERASFGSGGGCG
ncbi:helix-hairpin-helix domain-containing protein [Desulfonatronum parangueonense]